MTLCEYCIRIGHAFAETRPRSGRFRHQPSFEAFLESTKTCPLCLFLHHALVLDDESSYGEEIRKIDEGLPREIVATKDVFCQLFSIDRLTPGRPSELTFEIHGDQTVARPRNQISGQVPIYARRNEVDGSNRAFWSNRGPISFADRLPVLQKWINDCQQKHQECASHSKLSHTRRPKRLVYIGSDNLIDHAKIVLIENISGTNLQYTTLSHCWGSQETASKTLQLKRASEFDLQKALPAEAIPASYRDAMAITRALGLQYIWIDSLCIVQDDYEDWQVEASKMASVYSQSYLTIAATNSEDSYGGCFLDIAKSSTHIDMPVGRRRGCGRGRKHPRSSLQARHFEMAYFRHDIADVGELIDSPLSRRAWVMQESVLSPRTLHCTKNQFYWHCHSRLTSEDGWIDEVMTSNLLHERTTSKFLFHDFSTKWNAYNTWFGWELSFLRRELTYQADRLASLAGVIEFYASKTQDKSLLGLWESLLWCQLNWTLDHVKPPPKRVLDKNFPSWSWLSWSKHQTAMNVGETFFEKVQDKLQVKRSDVAWGSQNYTSGIRQAILVVCNRVKNITLSQASLPDKRHWSYERSRGCYVTCDFDEIPSQEYFLVNRITITALLLYGTEELHNGNGYDEFFIVLQKTKDEQATYRRIGAGHVSIRGRKWLAEDEPMRFFHDGRMETVSLV